MARRRMEELKLKPKKVFRDGKWRIYADAPIRRTK